MYLTVFAWTHVLLSVYLLNCKKRWAFMMTKWRKCSFSHHWHRNAQYAFCAKNIQRDPCARIVNHNSIHSLTTLLCHSIKITDRKPVKENCAQMNLLTETRLFCNMIRVKAMWTWKKSSGSVICQAGRYVSGKTGMLQGQTAAPGNPSRLCRLQTWMTLTLSVSCLCMRSQGF